MRKRYILPLYGVRETPLYRLLPVLVPLFMLFTRLRYGLLARQVAREIADYARLGIEVVGIVVVGGSPSCGVRTTLDLRQSIKVLAACPVAQLDRRTMTEQAIVACRGQGQGMFVEALRRHLARRRLSVAWYEHDLLDEISGRRALLQPGE